MLGGAMNARSRGRPRGRPKGSGRGRGRGRACQTEGTMPRCASRSPPPPPSALSSRPAADGSQHLTGSSYGLPLSPHPGAPPGIYPYILTSGMQPPGLPCLLSPVGGPHEVFRPRPSSGKSDRREDSSSGKMSAGTQASWQTMQHGAGHVADSPSRQSSSSKLGPDSCYSRHNGEQAFHDHHLLLEQHQQERPTARKTHRQPRHLPFQQEFEPTYGGQKEKALSINVSPKRDRESYYAGQRQSGDKSYKGQSHRIQFHNMEPTYHKQKRDPNHPEQRHMRDGLIVDRTDSNELIYDRGRHMNSKHDSQQAYDRKRLVNAKHDYQLTYDKERHVNPKHDSQQAYDNERHVNPKQDRNHFIQLARRDKNDVRSSTQRHDSLHRSCSSDSSHSSDSQGSDRHTSPHFNPSPLVDYPSHAFAVSPRHNSADRDRGLSKHGDGSCERIRPPGPVRNTSPATSRQRTQSFLDCSSRDVLTDNVYTSGTYCVESYRNNSLGKSGKSSKCDSVYLSVGAGPNSSSLPTHRPIPCPDQPDPQIENRTVLDHPMKKIPEQGSNLRNNPEKGVNVQSDRDRSSSRKKQLSSMREQSADLQAPLSSSQNAHLPHHHYYTNSYAANLINNVPPSRNERRKRNKVSPEEDHFPSRLPQQQFDGKAWQNRPSRTPRPSTPSPPSSPHHSAPPTPAMYSPRASSPPIQARYMSPRRQQSQGSPHTKRPSRPTGTPSSNPPTPQPGRRRTSENSPDLVPPLAEPMAWQQQYLKHLQQQQDLQEEQVESNPSQLLHLHLEHGKQLERGTPHCGRIEETEHTSRETARKDQMRKQQEQMQREMMKILMEKLHRQHLKQKEQLDIQQMKQLDQLRKEHMRQQKEILQGDVQREHIKQQQERLQTEQLKQLEKMKREHIKQQEHMQRQHQLQQETLQHEHGRLQQDQLQRGTERWLLENMSPERFTAQENMQTQTIRDPKHTQQQQEIQTPERSDPQTHQGHLPEFIEQWYEQIQKQHPAPYHQPQLRQHEQPYQQPQQRQQHEQPYQQPQQRQQHEQPYQQHQQQPQQRRQQEQPYQQDPRQRDQQEQPYQVDPRQRDHQEQPYQQHPQQQEQKHQQEQPELRQQNHSTQQQQTRPADCHLSQQFQPQQCQYRHGHQQHQPSYDSRHQQQLQQSSGQIHNAHQQQLQQSSDQVHIAHQQQSHQTSGHVHIAQKQVMRQQQQDRKSSHLQQHKTAQLPPVPPWRQTSANVDTSGQTIHQTDVSAANHHGQNTVESSLHQLGGPGQPTSTNRWSAQDGTPLHPDTQLPQSAIQQTHHSLVTRVSLPYAGSQCFVPTTTVAYDVANMDGIAQSGVVFQNQVVYQYPGLLPQRQNAQQFEGQGSTQVSASSATTKPKKPPWLQDQEDQLMAPQKQPPWQQSQPLSSLLGQQFAIGSSVGYANGSSVGNASQYISIAHSTAGLRCPIQQQNAPKLASSAQRKLTGSQQEMLSQQHQTYINAVVSAPREQSMDSQQCVQHQTTFCSNNATYQSHHHGLYTQSSTSQSNIQTSVHSQGSLSRCSESSVVRGHIQNASDQQIIPVNASKDGQEHPKEMHVVSHHRPWNNGSQLQTSVLCEQGGQKSNHCQYRTPRESSHVTKYHPVTTQASTDEECAQQVLVEALNEQIQQTTRQNCESRMPDAPGSMQGEIPIHTGANVHVRAQHSAVSVTSMLHHAHNVNSAAQTYTLYHPFDDSIRPQPQPKTQTSPHALPQTVPAVPVSYVQQDPFQQQVVEGGYHVVSGDALNTVVATLNTADGMLDLPSIEQHQVFVLEPPNKHQMTAPTPASVTSLRRNSWHTPENSINGSRSGSVGDDDAVMFNDLTAELIDDDDLFLPVQPAADSVVDSKQSSQITVKVPFSDAMNDSGLRISGVFSLATCRRKKRRAMSDSILQEVEVVARQQALTEDTSGHNLIASTAINSQHFISMELLHMQKFGSAAGSSNLECGVLKDEKSVSMEEGLANRDSPDPLAQLTKLLFSDVTVPSPGTTAVEDWNLNEAAGVSFEADSVCVPGTPARGEPERLATPLPQLFTPMPQLGTPMPQLGTPMPHYYKEPATPFPRCASVSQTIKTPATPLPACAKDMKEPVAQETKTCVNFSDLKEPKTPWPFPVKEFKEPDTPLSSCVMGPPTPLSNLPVKNKDPCFPLPQCSKQSALPFEQYRQQKSEVSDDKYGCSKHQKGDCSVVLPFERYQQTSEVSDDKHDNLEPQKSDGVFEVRVEDMQKSISESVERVSQKPLEQAIRELLGNAPIKKVSEKSFKKLAQSPLSETSPEKSQKEPEKKAEGTVSKEKVTFTHQSERRGCRTQSSDKDLKERIQENWDKRCSSKDTPVHKAGTSKSRNSRRETVKDRQCIQPVSKTVTRRYCLRNKTSPAVRDAKDEQDAGQEDADRKTCGVRGRQAVAVTGRRRMASGKQNSQEDHSPDPQQPRLSENSETDLPFHRSLKKMSQDNSVGMQDSETSRTQNYSKDKHQEDSTENPKQNEFFPNLSRSNSLSSSLSDDDDDEADEKEGNGRQRLQSPCVTPPRRPAQGSRTESVGETIADLILPTVLPPSKRKGRTERRAPDLLATFHQHQLRCVEMDGDHYVVLEEILAKCFPGLPRSEVERVRVRDLNLLTRTVHLLGSGLKGCGGEAVSVLALSDAARLLHVFHDMMQCPRTDCKLRTVTKDCRHRTLPENSDKGNCDRESSNKVASDLDVPRSERLSVVDKTAESDMRVCGRRKVSGAESELTAAVSGRRKMSSNGEEENDKQAEGDGQEDTRSCSSDQTVPYCDGQPMASWDADTLTKTYSDGSQHVMYPQTSPLGVDSKLRRHSSDWDSAVGGHRDQDGLATSYLAHSPITFSRERTSPMLPPLPTYASPYTPGSVCNERVLLECFSAPGSQAPSSVRSAPSVRLTSPYGGDVPHLDEDLCVALSNRKSLLDYDVTTENAELQSRLPVSLMPSVNESEVDDIDDSRFTDSRINPTEDSRTESMDYFYHDFTHDYDAEDADDVFLENETPCQVNSGEHGICIDESKEADILGRTEISQNFFPHDHCAKGRKSNADLLYKERKTIQSNEVCINYAFETDSPPSSPGNKDCDQKQVCRITDDRQSRSVEEESEKRAKELSHELSKVSTTTEDLQCNVASEVKSAKKTVSHEVNLNLTADSEENESCRKMPDNTMCPAKNNVSGKNREVEDKPAMDDGFSVARSMVATERSGSDVTVAYGVSDEDMDGNSNSEGLTQKGLASQSSTGPPDLSTAKGSVPTNPSPHTSPPRIEPATSCVDLQKIPDENEVDSSEYDKDDIKPPGGGYGSLEDRVQDFIAHGSQFTLRTMVRSNSLPHLCGVETLASPLRNCEKNILHIPGTISYRSNSYPRAGDRRKLSDNSAVLSPAVPLVVPSVDSDNEEDILSYLGPDTALPSVKQAADSEDVSGLKEPGKPSDCEDAVFLDAADMVYFDETRVKATPERCPEAGEVGDEMFQWALPCAAHGSVFCACEGIDVQAVQEVAASPKVGPWLCTPGTPMPGTPFCDYSKLIYSPFPIIGGMTPARVDTSDRIDTVDRVDRTDKVDSVGRATVAITERDMCRYGVKRLASPEGHPTPKRRPLFPTEGERDTDFGAEVCCDKHEESETMTTDASMTIDGKASFREECVVGSDEVPRSAEELELIAAAEESERNMAIISSHQTLAAAPSETMDTHLSQNAVPQAVLCLPPVENDYNYPHVSIPDMSDSHETAVVSNNSEAADFIQNGDNANADFEASADRSICKEISSKPFAYSVFENSDVQHELPAKSSSVIGNGSALESPQETSRNRTERKVSLFNTTPSHAAPNFPGTSRDLKPVCTHLPVPELSWEGSTSCGDTSLEGSTNCGDTDAIESSLEASTNSGDTSSEDFTKCGDTSLEESTNYGDTSFESSTQCGDTSLDGSTHCGDTSLEESTNCGDTSFESSTQSGDISLEASTHCGDTSSKDSTNCGDMSFERSTKSGDISLEAFTHCGDRSLDGSTHCGDTSLEESTNCGDSNTLNSLLYPVSASAQLHTPTSPTDLETDCSDTDTYQPSDLVTDSCKNTFTGGPESVFTHAHNPNSSTESVKDPRKSTANSFLNVSIESHTQREQSDASVLQVKILKGVSSAVLSRKEKVSRTAQQPVDTSDTNSVGTTDSESVNDMRIIMLADSDMDLASLESEESRDSTEVKLPAKAQNKVVKEPPSENKKTLTLAQYKERRKRMKEEELKPETQTSTAPHILGEGRTPSPTGTYPQVNPSLSQSAQLTSPKMPKKDFPVTSTKLQDASPGFLTSQDCLTSAQCLMSPTQRFSTSTHKVQRTESVPAELSRKNRVELKRSSSFHGEHPVSKRFRHETGEKLKTDRGVPWEHSGDTVAEPHSLPTAAPYTLTTKEKKPSNRSPSSPHSQNKTIDEIKNASMKKKNPSRKDKENEKSERTEAKTAENRTERQRAGEDQYETKLCTGQYPSTADKTDLSMDVDSKDMQQSDAGTLPDSGVPSSLNVVYNTDMDCCPSAISTSGAGHSLEEGQFSPALHDDRVVLHRTSAATPDERLASWSLDEVNSGSSTPTQDERMPLDLDRLPVQTECGMNESAEGSDGIHARELFGSQMPISFARTQCDDASKQNHGPATASSPVMNVELVCTSDVASALPISEYNELKTNLSHSMVISTSSGSESDKLKRYFSETSETLENEHDVSETADSTKSAAADVTMDLPEGADCTLSCPQLANPANSPWTLTSTIEHTSPTSHRHSHTSGNPEQASPTPHRHRHTSSNPEQTSPTPHRHSHTSGNPEQASPTPHRHSHTSDNPEQACPTPHRHSHTSGNPEKASPTPHRHSHNSGNPEQASPTPHRHSHTTRPLTSSSLKFTADNDDGHGRACEGDTGGRVEEQLSEQLAALLRERERMLAEFRQRELELTKTVEGLKEKLQRTEKEMDTTDETDHQGT